MHCLIIDDDPLVRQGLTRMLNKDNRISKIFIAEDGIEGTNLWNEHKQVIDFLILDIELPEMTGIEFLESMEQVPPVILISSKENYGPEAFDHDCVDYILKPIAYQRLSKALGRVEKALAKRSNTGTIKSNKIMIKSNNTHIQLDLDDILFVESEENYVKFYTNHTNYMVHATLKSVHEELPSDRFYKIQRSIVANIYNIQRIRGNIIEFQSEKETYQKTTTKKEELLGILPVLNKK
ncbi:LytTR family DNA-binding domain-containing protein [Halosquirtibacter xylanolyticus]|uniref:LytR/AlgR family response regulator transcription factor n=1 Tax=Halosquirtibacter xylanolyticus TaxID=3374599 RepID=UPI003747C3F6|nr:LytTR family DNA-binding domain-containing protein [Prolixibacteraceae bacterium]